MSDQATAQPQSKMRVLPFKKMHTYHQGRVLNHWPNGHKIVTDGIVLELVSRNLNKDTLTFAIHAVVMPPKEEG